MFEEFEKQFLELLKVEAKREAEEETQGDYVNKKVEFMLDKIFEKKQEAENE